jgi:hypothetical protein
MKDDQLEKIAALKFYLLMNHEGLFFRRKGYGGVGDSWVAETATARIYTNIRGARSVLGYFNNNYSDPKPVIVEVQAGSVVVLDEGKRLEKARKTPAQRLAEEELRKERRRLKEAEQGVDRARRRLEKVKGTV